MAARGLITENLTFITEENMKSGVKIFVTLGLILLFLTPAYAWKSKIAKNQLRVAAYITELRKGGHPDKIERPKLRRDQKAKANAVNRELRAAMDEAEKLARAGKHKKIKKPKFKHQLMSKEGYKNLKKEVAKE